MSRLRANHAIRPAPTFARMEPHELAKRVVDRMMEEDAFSRWLGIEVLETAPGSCRLRMTVRPEMNNGFRITHGGIAYCAADSALAFASNSHGIHAVSIETSISHVKPVKSGDVLTAQAEEMSRSSRIAVYHVSVTNQEGTTVALFKGTVFRTGKEWEV
jgi:acyl-CoA thioesterase